tara:strand:- start:47 stop:418 length:372 start_codon:yes stop_codon:yes gene_type:complete
MNITQETIRQEQGRERAVMHLNDYLYEASIEDFCLIVNEMVRKHYNNNQDKREFNSYAQQHVDLTVNKCSPTARRIAQSLESAEDAEDFAKYTAEVLHNEYGSHNFKGFITKLINELDNDTIG